MAGERPTTGKVDPETLALRAAPRRVVRFKRRLMIGIAAVGIAGIFGVTWLALKGPILRFGQQAQELYSTDRKSTAEGLDGLPKDYGEMKPETPVLGPPLPGDLGPPILARQKQLGQMPGVPESEADREAEAERQRLAQLARAAREASVFFQVTNQTSAVASQDGGQAHQSEPAENQFSSPVGNRLSLDPDHDPNNQQRKLDFLNDKSAAGIYNSHTLQDPASPYQVMAGTVIEAALVTGLNSDLPSEVIAQTTTPIFDSVTGQILLVPQGSRLIGSYDSVIAFGQSRALVVWRRIVLPDGSSIEIDNLPATDAAGYAGLEDEVDFHTWRIIKGVALATLLGVATELSIGDGQSDLVRALQQSAQQSTNAAGQRLIEKNLNIQPTITVRPGWPLRVIVEKDLVLRPYRG
jgi:type IV secretion system protein VirB10